MKSKIIIFFGFVFFACSCSIAPEPINYNFDECAYCKMKISDKRFGAELVTTKGKIKKYDSAECLIRTYIEEDSPSFAYLLVTDFSLPATLIDALSANYLISEAQPSPMGGNLSAYAQQELALSVQKEKGGDLMTFDQLVSNYKLKFQ